MDDLVRHIIRELSFDGDLGCSVSRLEDFIKDFYHKTKAQNVDEAYCAFIWSVIVQESTVRVGVLPSGEHTEVYVAPQTSAKRKATKKAEQVVEESATTLSVVSDAAIRSLDDLKLEYGDRLRIAVDPDTSFAAITGSHIRPSKLTPMVYTALQFITRGREKGISVVELGRKTSYDQKTCFYLVKQLESLDLVVKIRRAGVGTHFCMHKYFHERSAFWKSVREEEAVDHSIFPEDAGQTDNAQGDSLKAPRFDPIDSRHLSSLPLLRGRIVKLLNNSINNLHPSQNLLITLGFERPTKTDRRFFAARLAELVKEGIIEKVLANGKVQCIRLVNKGDGQQRDLERDGIVVLPPEAEVDEDAEEDKEDPQEFHLKANTVIHKQIIDLLHNAGSRGMTLSEISQQLCNFDRRTIELLLQRLEKDPPPSHLLNLGIAVVTETHGRERRHRYYIYEAYRALLEREKFDDTDGPYSSVDMSNAGNFLDIAPEQFYKSQEQLFNYQDTFREQENKHKVKKHKITNPILEDGTVKKGRPRKNHAPKKVPLVAVEDKRKKRKQGEAEGLIDSADDGIMPPEKRRKAENSAGVRSEADQTKPTPKKRGRPRKTPVDDNEGKPSPIKRKCPPQREACLSTGVEHSPAENLGESPLGEPDASLAIHHHDREIDPHLLDSSLQLWETETQTHDTQFATKSPADTSSVALPEISMLPSVPLEDNAHISADSPVTQSTTSEHLKFAVVELARSLSEKDTTAIPVFGSKPIRQEQSDFGLTDRAAVNRIDILNKRSHDDGEAWNTPAKRIKLSKAGSRKTNVSHLRRDNELFRVIQEFGGITVVNMREFQDAHIALIETLAKSGEPSSAPVGTRLDRRTVDAAIQKLESDCRIKIVKTSLCTATGSTRPVTIAHLFDMEQKKVNEFLSNLNGTALPSGRILPKPKMLDLDADHGSNIVPISPTRKDGAPKTDHVRWRKNVKQATQLFSYDDATIHDIFQRESTTISQSYGYITGRIARARELHLEMLSHFQSRSNSSRMVSSDLRIVHLTYFLQDISISTYCKLLFISTRMDELDDLFQEEGGRQTLLGNLSTNIYSGIGIGVSKSRARLLEILEVLGKLKLVTPLKPSQSASPEILCADNGTHPAAFDIASPNMLSPANAATVSLYWRFNVTAPIFLWALSDTAPLPWRDVSILSHAEGLIYWDDLRRVCLDSEFAKSLHESSHGSGTVISEGDHTIGKPLCKVSSWRSSYMLSWYQKRYLWKFIDSNPLWDEIEGDARIKSITRVIRAPEQVIRQFYAESGEKRTRELRKARLRVAQGNVPAQATKDKESLAKKAAERKIQRQQEWDALVARLHPEPIQKPLASRLKRIHDEYMKATSVRESQKWEFGIAEAIRGIKLATSKVLLPGGPTSAVEPPVLPSLIPPAVVHSSEKSVDELIAQQGPHQSSSSAKTKGQKKNEEESPLKKRRGRFIWNRDYDELAKDVSVIIKARCRSGQRIEWAAAEQAFPSLLRNSVRQRVDRLSKEPGVEAYLRRLEDKWYDLWMKHRSTQLLPDPEPSNVSNFDLVKHLKFLRAHIDKSSLRTSVSQSDVWSYVQLSHTLDGLLSSYDVVEKSLSAPSWDFVWTTATEEGREKQMFCQAFVLNDEFALPTPTYDSDSLYVAEAAIKMVLGTKNDSYDPEAGALLLHRIGEQLVSATTTNLLDRGILSKLIRDPLKTKPGRTLKISDTNSSALGGPLPKDVFQDASSLEESAMEEQAAEGEDWREWPLLASDGDMVTLIELVSEDKVDFKIDTSRARAARMAIEWNSKKADDDDIETGIQIRMHELSWTDIGANSAEISTHALSKVPDTEDPPSLIHGRTIKDEPACCRRDSTGVIDCQVCLDQEYAAFSSCLDKQEVEAVNILIKALDDAGSSGIHKDEILSNVNAPEGTDIFLLVDRMCQSSIPLVYWTGYLSIVLISAVHLAPWTVVVRDKPLTRILSRRWIDIRGMRMTDVWEAGLRAVIGIIVFRPGITQAELRWRLRCVYDRQETSDLLRYLEDESPLSDREELGTLFFLGSRHWYHV